MSIRLISGDARDVLATLPADSVHTVVTSPPYYALRSYLDASHADKHREIGSEPTPEAYLQTMVEVFSEIRRVLRPDGTCWVNVGDSYSGNGTLGRNDAGRNFTGGGGNKLGSGNPGNGCSVSRGAKPKDLLMMPARLALALQADGWWIRSDIIWHKPNPMPESCTDRPTSAHEHVFLLTRSSRYYYDADAVREPQTEGTIERFGNGCAPRRPSVKHGGSARCNASWETSTAEAILPNGRNLRNVWTLATHPYIHAHFATYPPALAERCIRAGTSERGCCAQCGKPWTRVTERNLVPTASASYRPSSAARGAYSDGNDQGSNRARDGHLSGWMRADTTTGWQPGCSHDADIVPATVLDPFIGAGTTALVADRLQRDCIGIDLNTSYTQMAMDRVRADAPLFADLAPVPSEDAYDRDMRDLFEEAAD